MEEVLDLDQPSGTRKLKGANDVLAMGIASIIFFSIIGLALAGVAIYKAKMLKSEFEANPTYYAEKYLKRINAGRICALAGLGVKAILIIVLIIVVG